MKRLKILFLFTSLFLLRWMAIESPLPESWTPESKIRFTATITDEVEYTDSQTIVRSGIWYIRMKGYAVIIPGSRIAFVGTVAPKVLGNKVTQIVMVDPTFEVLPKESSEQEYRISRVIVLVGRWRTKWVQILEKTLPEPMSSLAAGILLGVKARMPEEFYESLVNTGTLHIVAASGYNVSIVATVLMNMLSCVVGRGAGVGLGVVGIILYVLVSGLSASVVRAGIMGSLTLIAYYFGRPAEARRLLWVTGVVMLLINPLLIADIGFQLSFVATCGLLYIEPWIGEKILGSRIKDLVGVKEFLKEYLFPTLAATVATLPVILWHFGRVSWISPVVNMLVLPMVPLIMSLTAITIGVGSLSILLGQVVAWIAYGPLWWVTWVIKLLG